MYERNATKPPAKPSLSAANGCVPVAHFLAEK